MRIFLLLSVIMALVASPACRGEPGQVPPRPEDCRPDEVTVDGATVAVLVDDRTGSVAYVRPAGAPDWRPAAGYPAGLDRAYRELCQRRDMQRELDRLRLESLGRREYHY